jgi:hypothetical protein
MPSALLNCKAADTSPPIIPPTLSCAISVRRRVKIVSFELQAEDSGPPARPQKVGSAGTCTSSAAAFRPIATDALAGCLSTLAARGNCEPALSSTTHSRPVSTTTIVLYLAHFLTSLATRHPTRATSRSTITLSGADVPPPSLHSFIVPIGPAVTPFRHPSIHCPPPFYSLSSAASTHTQRVDYFRSTPAPGQQLYIYTPYSP